MTDDVLRPAAFFETPFGAPATLPPVPGGTGCRMAVPDPPAPADASGPEACVGDAGRESYFRFHQ